ncbi:MAG TPA: hypothetical protein VHB98_15140 [Chloroflexota bacterium]|nr:hypothetical protein [Chloroflexota bacterium]
MHLPRRSLACALLPVGVFSASALYLHGGLIEARLLDASSAFVEPRYVQAGVPFIVRDNYATLVCISNHSGYPLEPFISPTHWSIRYQYGTAPSYVEAGMPFRVQDSEGTQFCISTRSGRPLMPFLTAQR